MSRNITIGKVRFSYVSVFTPRKNNNDTNAENEKYTATFLIPKSDVSTYNAVMGSIEEAKQEGLSGAFKGSLPPTLAIPLHDGDGVKESTGEPYGPECKGHWVMTASSKIQPFVVDANIQPILQQNQFYSGCYGMASIRFFPYGNQKKGIGCYLNGVQKLEDGEPLGGGITPEEAFRNVQVGLQQQGAWPNGAAAQPAYQQPQYQTPPQQAYQQPYPGQQGYPQGQPQVDPVTGQPYTGGVMGI